MIHFVRVSGYPYRRSNRRQKLKVWSKVWRTRDTADMRMFHISRVAAIISN
jgi:hypothetical protein